MRPHDLLRLKPGTRLVGKDAPAWVAASLSRNPFVVVRRATVADELVAIGVRGETRAERFGDAIRREDISEVITPELLAETQVWRSTARHALPIFTAMNAIEREAAEIGLRWGPGGSAGFELATHHPTVTEASDLDIIIRPTSAHTPDTLGQFRDAISRQSFRVDIVVEASQGAVALDEWLVSPQRVLIKTSHGPQLGAFSW
jgi:phosphoribosyl-dephospho-CoA transferase